MDKHDKYEAVKQAWFEINEQLRNNKQEYIDYLKFSAKMYKQPYSDAVLVFQQDRNATKIAEYKKWGRLGRYVRRGSHGVAVFGKNHTCRYLYDVTQTGGKELPEMWTLTDRNTPELLNTLNNRYNINAGSVKECIEAMTANSINSAPIAESVQNAISQMGLDTKQAEVYRHSLDSVVRFVVSQRCNLSGKIDLHADVDVSALDLIKNARDMILFSRAVQHAAKDTLFEIEKEVIAIDRKNEALDNAKNAKQESTSDRVDDILQDLIKLKFSQEQVLALKQAVVAAAQNGEHNIRHWVSVRYSPDELQHISSLLSDYYAQSVIEQTLDPKGILNDYYTYVNELNGRLKLSDMFSHHDYSDEQKAMLQQGFSEGISITVLNEVDERLTVDEIKTFFEMFHQAVDGQIDPHDVQIYLDKAVIEHSKKNVQAVEAQDNSVDTNSIGIVKGEKSFAEQVDDVLAGNANRYNDLKVCDTPQILLDVGCEQLPMFYTKRHLHDALKPKGNTGESIHYHGLNAEQIKKMPMLLENPVIIYDSLSRNDSIIIVTSELDNEKMPIIAAIKPNGKAKYDLELVESNFVMSFHGRNNFENQINRAVEQNKVLYYNKEKSQELFSVLGLQLSKGLNILDSNIIIHQSRNIVKGTQQENIEYKNNSVTQQDKKIEPSRIIGLAENQLRPAVPNSSTSSITDSSGVVKSEKTLPKQITHYSELLAKSKSDMSKYQEQQALNKEFEMTIGGVRYDKRENAGEQIAVAMAKCTATGEPIELGTYRGFKVTIERNPSANTFFELDTPCIAVLHGELTYSCDVATDNGVGNVRRIENLAGIQINQKLCSLEEQLEKANKDLSEAQQNMLKPFEHGQELAEKTKRLEYVNAQLSGNSQNKNHTPESAIEFRFHNNKYQALIGTNEKSEWCDVVSKGGKLIASSDTKIYNLSEKESDQFRSYVFNGGKTDTSKNNSLLEKLKPKALKL